MPKNTVSDPITGQEIAFARLILSGTMNDPVGIHLTAISPAPEVIAAVIRLTRGNFRLLFAY